MKINAEIKLHASIRRSLSSVRETGVRVALRNTTSAYRLRRTTAQFIILSIAIGVTRLESSNFCPKIQQRSIDLPSLSRIFYQIFASSLARYGNFSRYSDACTLVEMRIRFSTTKSAGISLPVLLISINHRERRAPRKVHNSLTTRKRYQRAQSFARKTHGSAMAFRLRYASAGNRFAYTR